MLGRIGARFSERARAPRPGPLGLAVGGSWLHLAQWQLEGEAPALRAIASVPLGEVCPSTGLSADRLRSAVADARRMASFSPGRVVTSLLPSQVRIMVLGYRSSARGADEELIATLVAERMQEPLDRCVIDYVSMRTTGDKHGEKSALVAIARQETVARCLDVLHRAGLEPEALEIEPVALRRLVTTLSGNPKFENSLVIHCGIQLTQLTFLWGRRLVLYRELEFGEERLVERVTTRLKIDATSARSMLHRFGVAPAKPDPNEPCATGGDSEISHMLTDVLRSIFQDLIEGINEALVYAASLTHAAPIHKVLLCGLASWPGSAALIGELLGSPVHPLDPLAVLSESGGQASGEIEPPPDPSVALGLALRGLV